ncbi:acyl-protein synthetase [Alteromonas sp. H39]|uniref:LuxE/PaaK family acyltransferase n=1 Tax=Alteromonas sp. H39 TaxID=3389876 RepID=UPI0039E1AFE0
MRNTTIMINQAYQDNYQQLLTHDVYALRVREKHLALLPVIQALHQHHKAHSPAYSRLIKQHADDPATLEEMPFLAVRLFKQFALRSVPEDEVFRVLQSSGTSGQTPAKVFLDKATSARQSKALVKIMQNFIGKQRLPMLVIDAPSTVKSGALSARAAGIQGMAFFGRQTVFALNDDMSLNMEALESFQNAYGDQSVLVFGFTFMVWAYFLEALQAQRKSLSLSKGVLVHSGGWKKLVEKQVDNVSFKSAVSRLTGISRVHNFYGMAEQVGTVFVECEQGHLHVPVMAELIVRDPYTLEVCKTGEQGLLQVISAIPTSYPGFSLLTEDLGRVLGQDDCPCGRSGKYFEVLRRLPKTEVRGCSDTQVSP